MNSPKPSPVPLSELKKRASSGTQQPVESPLRKASFPHSDTAHLKDDVLDSEDENVIHVDGHKVKRGSKITGGGEKDNKLDLGPDGYNNGFFNEHGDGTPILASDEVEKRPGSAFLQPAVSPEAERSDWLDDASRSRRGSGQPDSRPGSRPGSMHGGPLSRFISQEERPASGLGTPLEEIEEYEPLFPEDDDKKASPSKRFKSRPGLAQHHFPSADVWEDTPASLQFTTSVETPEPPQVAVTSPPGPASSVFETPEQEQRRRQAGPEMTSDSKTFAKPHFKPGVQHELERPGVQRFPSQDIWEDTPESMRLETTVSGPQEPEITSPQEDRPTTTALASSQDDNDARATTGMSQLMRPHIPSRPARSSKLSQDITPEIAPVDPREKEVPDLGALKETSTSPTKTKPPSIPDRPKPTVPARPTRSPKPEDASRALSPEEPQPAAAAAAKPKPAVPARPANGKFANLKSGFMSDLASRIQLGPGGPPPKAKEPDSQPAEEEQKAPLADARKSRAKGPQRRKPAASPSGAAAPAPAQAAVTFAFSSPVTVFEIDEGDALNVPSVPAPAPEPEADSSAPADLQAAEKALEANAASNSEAAAPAPAPAVVGDSADDAHRAAQIGAEGDEPEPKVSAPVQREADEVRGEFEEALRESEQAGVSKAVEGAEAPAAGGVGVGKEMPEGERGVDGLEGERVGAD